MALTGIVNLAERLLNQSQSQTPAEQAPAATTPSAQNGSAETPVTAAANLDQFTSSNSNTAQDAGLFSVKTLSLFTAAANFILGTPSTNSQNTAAQSKAGNQGDGTANAPAAATTNTTPATNANAGAGPAASAALGTLTAPTASTANVAPAPAAAATAGPTTATTNGASTATGSNAAATTAATAATSAEATATTASAGAAPAATSAAAAANSAAAASDANATTTLPTPGTPTFIPPASITQTADSSAQLQSLNNSLAALGLSASDISSIDRIASLLNDFSPTAYTSLVEQLVAQAQSQAAQTAAAATTPTAANVGATDAAAAAAQNVTPQTNLSAAAPVNAGTAATASAVPNGNGGPGGGLQVQSLVLRFAGVTASAKTGPTSATNAATPSNTNTLQLQDVSLTLSNNSGQSATLFAPQPDAAGNTNARAAVA